MQALAHLAQGVELYAESSAPTSIADCHFYHTMDLPGYGTIAGEWDLRDDVDAYLGHFDFAGQRVLDVGAASGMLSFHAEARGAEVVSFDLSDRYDWDIVPFAVNDHAAAREDRRAHLRRINNGYWLCHRALGSRARVVHGVAYDIPAAIGPVDVSIFGSILLHLRDPFLALENGARLTTEAMIVADISPWSRLASRWRRTPRFMPHSDRPQGISDGWFRLPPLLVCEYLAILGFARTRVTWHTFRYGGRDRPIYTIVARR